MPVCALFFRPAISGATHVPTNSSPRSVSFSSPRARSRAFAQTGDDAVRVTVAMNPDGSKTVYQKDGADHQAIATTTGADGKPHGKIIYKLDSEGRYESGQVFAANGSLAFQDPLQYDSAGRLRAGDAAGEG